MRWIAEFKYALCKAHAVSARSQASWCELTAIRTLTVNRRTQVRPQLM